MRFAVLGSGFWATEVHSASLAAHPEAELVGIWGRDEAKAVAAGARHDVPGTADLDALLADVDAVSISVPPSVQPDLAVRAAEAGCHLLLEKPVALSVPDAERVVAATTAAGVASVVFLTYRFREQTASWLEQASRSALVGGSVTWLASTFAADSPFRGSVWRAEPGAPLWDLGPHALSLMEPALGPVVAALGTRAADGTVNVVLEHEGGATSTHTLSASASSLSAGEEFWVHGDAGRLVLLPPPEGSAHEAHAVAVTELQAAALTGGAHPCDAGYGAHQVRVLAAAEAAVAAGARRQV
ncbi:Predicted dehydrogenase [Klenkia marina]|uniref:Predicted dehydrogenase n=1 Tax=Klenkia marina TaxID=1960309 RepID=A0A1G4Y255_9ACTN|nr:Gfo/Idh/MocA family oxidoreductase [Klenkia marina]SCX47440.1 Predicted dehydrogenase [Klenkia marina]